MPLLEFGHLLELTVLIFGLWQAELINAFKSIVDLELTILLLLILRYECFRDLDINLLATFIYGDVLLPIHIRVVLHEGMLRRSLLYADPV